MKKIFFITLIIMLGLTACKEAEPDDKINIEDTFQSTVDIEDIETSDENIENSGVIIEENEEEIDNNDDIENESSDDVEIIIGEESNPQDDASVETILWLTPTYEYDGDASKIFLNVENEQLTEVKGNTFSATYTNNEGTYDVKFEWCVVGNKVEYRTDKNFPVELNLETISGCTSKILIAQTVRQMDRSGFKVCNLENNTIEPLFGGRIDAELSGSYYIQYLNPELTGAIVIDHETENIYYYDAQRTIDLNQLISDYEGFEFDRVIGSIFNDEILICGMLADGYWEDFDVYTYRYHIGTGEIVRVLDGSTYTDVVSYKDFRYLTYYKYGELFLLDPYTGRHSGTGIQEREIKSTKPISEDYFMIESTGYMISIYHAETGRKLTTVQLSNYTSSSELSTVYYEGNLHIRISDKRKTYIYEIEYY